VGAAMRHDIVRRHWGGAVGGRTVGSGAGGAIGGGVGGAIGGGAGGVIGSGASSDRWIAVGSQVGGWFGCSPYNYPPFRIASTRCNGQWWDGAEGNGAKSQSANAVGGGWVSCMEFINRIEGIIEIIPVFPSVVLHTVTFPFDQVLQFPVEHAAVENFFHNILLFAVNKLRWRRRCMSTSNGVNGCEH